MRLHGLAISLALFLVPLVTHSQVSPIKDADAIAVLAHTIAASGWQPGNVPLAIEATATVFRLAGEPHDSINIRIKYRGPHRFRLDAQDGGKTTSTIINSTQGAVVTGEKTRRLPMHAAASMPPPLFPFLTDLGDAAHPNVELRYLGIDTVFGETAHRIRITRKPAEGDLVEGACRPCSTITVWVLTSSSLPIQIEYARLASDNPMAVTHYKHAYADYRAVDCITIPFRQEQYAADRLEYRLELSDVRLNAAVSDSDFQVPSGR